MLSPWWLSFCLNFVDLTLWWTFCLLKHLNPDSLMYVWSIWQARKKGQFPVLWGIVISLRTAMLDHNSSTISLSQMAVEALPIALVLYWSSTQSVLCDYMYTPSHSYTTNLTHLYCPWLFLAIPVSVPQLEYSAILICYPQYQALVEVHNAESGVFTTYMLPVPPSIKECTKCREWVFWNLWA